MRDASGDLFDTTWVGGKKKAACKPSGCGVVFKISAAGVYSVLYAFTNHGDGMGPRAGLIQDAAGTLYGTTSGAGATHGSVFAINAAGQETTLYSFTTGNSGGGRYGPLVEDASGNLYGTTFGDGPTGQGNVFEITAAGAYVSLYDFAGGADGAQPASGLLLVGGDLIGTTVAGGNPGGGTVFDVNISTKQKTVLYNFNGGSGYNDGVDPIFGPLVLDSVGNIYGTCEYGGTSNYGTIYELIPIRLKTDVRPFARAD